MSPTTTTVQGTVQPDGTLQLDEPLQLPAGRVIVTVQALPAPGTDPFWDTMERIWAMRPPDAPQRTKEEIDAERRAFREEFKEGFLKTERLYEECRRAREQTKPEEPDDRLP